VVTITPTSSSITTYTDAEINYLDSSLNVIGATGVVAYPTEADRNNDTNEIAGWVGEYKFKYAGVWAGTVYLKVNLGFVAYKDVVLSLGENTVDFGTTGLLSNIDSKIDKVNRNVIKASKFIPASEV
jgi:hypothetical protein